MTITIEKVGVDAVGFPEVIWTERRNSHAGGTVERVTCGIARDAKTGALLFVRRGRVRLRVSSYEDGRPWEALSGFSNAKADDLYKTPQEKRREQEMMEKSKALRVLWEDGAHVTLASFMDHGQTVFLHVNDASASPAEVLHLQEILQREFVGRRREFVKTLCAGRFEWPAGHPPMTAHDPARPAPSRGFSLGAAVMNFFFAIVALSMLALLVYLVLLLVGVVR